MFVAKDSPLSLIIFFDTISCCKLVYLHIFLFFSGEPMVAGEAGVWDNYSVKKQLLHSW